MQIKIEAPKTYKTEENALIAVRKKGLEDHRFFIMKNEEDRYFPVFVGMSAIEAGIHFHFNVVG